MRHPKFGNICRSPGRVPTMIEMFWRMFSSYSDSATPPLARSKWKGKANPLPRNSLRMVITRPDQVPSVLLQNMISVV